MIKEFCNRIFGKRHVAEAPVPMSAPKENVIVAPTHYNYGLDILGIALASQDYGWSDPDENHKKVVLCNPEECKEKISVYGMMSRWRGTGHFEWEAVLSGWFVKAVIDSIENEAHEADITHLFNRDFFASCKKKFTQKQVYDHLIKSFDIVEDDELLKLRIHI